MISKQMINGNKAERDIGLLFKKHGYWAHNFAKSQSGSQPVDVVAIKENECWLLDVKHLRQKDISFPISRVEPNQWACFDYARNFAKIKNLGIAICHQNSEIYAFWLPYDKLLTLKQNGSKSIKLSDLEALEELI